VELFRNFIQYMMMGGLRIEEKLKGSFVNLTDKLGNDDDFVRKFHTKN
jgi:hypothetical protein